jgi:gamma-glutamylcysteine synthetase
MAAELTMSLDRAFEKRLAGVINARARGVLQGGLKGVERESLRVTPTGRISPSRTTRSTSPTASR